MKRTILPSIVSLLWLTPVFAFAQSAPQPDIPPASTPPLDQTPPPPVGLPPQAQTPVAQSAASTPSPRAFIELSSLRLMREKGIISQAEFDSAVRDLRETSGLRAPDQATVVVGKWATTLYGFVEADTIWDSTDSLNDLAGNAGIIPHGGQVGGDYRGDNSRVTFGTRNSRIGFRLKAPEIAGGIRTTGQLEMDFLGAQLPVSEAAPVVSEGSYFASPVLRTRHMNLKIETPVVDILMGQYWSLFGWQSAYNPNTVEIQGVPGEIYSRTTQLRLSKSLHLDDLTVEAAVAATRPVQRDAGLPDGQAGLRVAYEGWTGTQTQGSTGTTISPISVALTGLTRRVEVAAWGATAAKNTNDLTLSAWAIDGFLPVLPGTKGHMGNSLAFNGEVASGKGFADQYTSLSGGIGFPAPPGGTYTPDIDSGIVTYDTAGNLHSIQWTGFLVGVQYYLPELDGKVWVSGNFSHLTSNNIGTFAVEQNTAKSVLQDIYWFDANVFVDPLPNIRFGLEYANFQSKSVSDVLAVNQRLQFSGFLLF